MRLALIVLAASTIAAQTIQSQESAKPPAIQREFRAVWVATVANIDWPSKPGLNSWEQQQELLAILNKAVELKLNAVILQVRPMADALYESPIEPWSEFLTGQMALPPQPPYDPLQFAIDAAHKRGLELHAWFNPYRAFSPTAKGDTSSMHVSRTHPEFVRKYGQFLWMDPGDPTVRARSIRVMLDVAKRYDVDGIHIDDYFYPYQERNSADKLIEFPDSVTYTRYLRRGGKLSRDDWRRSNVDTFVHELYRELKAAKPKVKFGISPFGIWRPGNPPSVKGLDSYSEIFADSRKWLANGWLDYFTPQLYWHTSRRDQDYSALLKWWVSQNSHERNIWPGNFTSRVGTTRPELWDATEIVKQIELTRAVPGATGNVHFSAKAFMQDKDSLNEKLEAGPYAEPALVPASTWLDAIPPLKPHVTLRRDSTFRGSVLELSPRGKEPVWLWTVRSHSGNGWKTAILPGWERRYVLTRLGAEIPDRILVTAVDRSGNESPVATAAIRR
jgi:uncharacterized lipoprotein YddW (UPF0748 family)